MTKRQLLTILIICLLPILTGSCSLKWTNPFKSETELEQTGAAVRGAAQLAIIVAHQQEPGEWATHVCSTAAIVLKALDGDSQAIEQINEMLNEISLDLEPQVYVTADDMNKKMSIELRNLLLGLLSYSASMWDMHGWDAVAASAIGIADAFLKPEVITDYAVWYLTREFFAGIVAGCGVIEAGP